MALAGDATCNDVWPLSRRAEGGDPGYLGAGKDERSKGVVVPFTAQLRRDGRAVTEVDSAIGCDVEVIGIGDGRAGSQRGLTRDGIRQNRYATRRNVDTDQTLPKDIDRGNRWLEISNPTATKGTYTHKK